MKRLDRGSSGQFLGVDKFMIKSLQLLVDIGSSSVKFYLLKDQELQPLGVKSLPLKDGFTPELGLSQSNKDQLFAKIAAVMSTYKNAETHVYATALFRKMTAAAARRTKQEFKNRLGVKLTIISHPKENKYLELAVTGKYMAKDSVLFINIGGGSTEVVVLKESRSIKTQNINLGVGNLNGEYPLINQKGRVTYYQVKEYVKSFLEKNKINCKVAFITGGELTYMQRAKYPLEKNTLFHDKDHPFMITYLDSTKRNQEIFASFTRRDLEELIPENPTWTHGTRAFLALADAICEQYQVEIVVPSDANLVNGIVRAHFIL